MYAMRNVLLLLAAISVLYYLYTRKPAAVKGATFTRKCGTHDSYSWYTNCMTLPSTSAASSTPPCTHLTALYLTVALFPDLARFHTIVSHSMRVV